MMIFFKLYFVALIVFLAIDCLWLGVIATNLYKEQIGFLMAKEIRWGSAILFYCLYIAGLVFFAVQPVVNGGSWILPLLYGGFFGLVTYATYDLTNYATLEGWPIKIVVYDLLWGSFISGITSLITFFIGNYWRVYFF